MRLADEADRTLFVGNLDSQVTEELLFELFLQAGPLIKVKIPKDNDGNSKQFAFVNFKHEVSVPYSMHLLSGIRLYGRQLNLKFRAGSSHFNQEGKILANSQNPGSANTPRYDRIPDQMGSPSYSPPQSLQKPFSSPESLQKQAMMNNMWQVQVQQMQQLASSFQLGMPQHQQQFRGGPGSPWQIDSPAHWSQRPAHQQDGSGHHGREQRQGGSEQRQGGSEQRQGGNERHRRDGHRGDFYQHEDRGGGRNRDYPPDRRRESRDRRWRRY